MKNKLKSLLALALLVLIGQAWAAELVIPYSFEGKAGNTEIPFEYKVVMPAEALSTFNVTVKYTGGNHRVDILGVKLLDGKTEYTAVATATDGNEVVEENASYSGGNAYHNVYTFTNENNFTAGGVYTLVATLKVTNDNPSHNGQIKLSNGVEEYLLPTFWASFDQGTMDSDKVTSSSVISLNGGSYIPVVLGGKAFSLNGDYYGEQRFLTQTPTAFTLSLNAKSGTAANGILIAFGNKNDSGGLVVRRGANGNEIIVTKANSTDAIITANAPGSSVGYTNIVLTYGNETLSLYINGDLAGTAIVTAGELIPGTKFQLGRRFGGLFGSTEANNVNGAIDELAAWDGTDLTANQVKAFYNENYADALKNTSIALFYEFEGTDAATFGNKAWDYNSPSSGNSSAEATYHNSARTKSGDIAYKSVVLDKNVHPGMSYSWPEEFTIATYVNLSECKTDGTIVSIGKSLLLRKIDGIRMALCNNGAIQYVWTEDENLSIGYHLIVVRKTATSLSLQIDDGPAQVVVLAEGNSPEITGGLQLGVRWEGGYASYDNTEDGVGVGPHLDDFLVWNGALSDASVANLCVIYPEILTEVVSAEPDGVGPHKLSDLITNGLKTGANVVATVTLADGATLEIDQALNFSELEIVSSGSIKVKVSDLTITQAQLNAIINTNGVSGTVSIDYEEHLEGYTVNGVTYPLIFRGTTDANWTTLSNWYTGYRRNSTDIYWIPYTGTVVPGAPNSNEWRATLVDGDLMVIAAGEDGYKTVTLPDTTNYEGWATKIAAYNKAHIVIGRANKFQSDTNSGPGFLRVDDTSKISFQAYGNGNGNGDKSIYVNAPEGVVFAEGTISGVKNMTYYFDGDGSVAFATLNEVQKIAGLELDLGDSTLSGRKVISRKLIGFTGGNATFTVAENAVTTSVDTVTPEAADILQNVGQYKFEQKADGYYVSYVAYAEANEIGAMNTWTATVDGNWATAGNWSSGSVPAEGATAKIAITKDTTITIPAAGVTVDTLLVSGKGTLTIAGGKITAAKVIMDGTGVTVTQETLDAAVVQGTQKTECLTFDVAENKAFTMLVKDCTLTKKGVAKLEFKKPASTAIFDTVNVTLEKGELALVLGDGNSDPLIADTTFTYVDADSDGEADGSLTNWGWVHSTTTTTFVVPENVTGKAFVGGNLTDTGAVIKRGDGVLLLGITANQNAGTYAGTTTIEAGMINYSVSGGATLSGVISGEGKVGLAAGTLTLTANNAYSGGTVIAEGTVLTAGTNSLGTGAVIGAGKLVVSGYPTNADVRNSLGDANWTGTYVNTANNTLQDTGNWLGAVGNENSVVEFTGANTGYLKQAGSMNAALKVTGSITFNNGWSSDGGYTFNGALLGTGTLATQNAQTDVLKFLGETKDFAGTITVAGGHCIAFGEQADDDTKRGKIVIAADKTANIAAGKTWTAVNGIEVAGTIGGEGTIGSTLILLNGATLANALTLEGNVTVAEGVAIKHAYAAAAGDTIITCANAEAVAAALTGAPEGLKYVAEDGAVKLAVDVVVVTPGESLTGLTEAEANAVVMQVTAPEGVDQETYAGYFTKTVTLEEDGTYTVSAILDAAVVTPTIAGTTEGDTAKEAFVVNADGSVALNIANRKAGLHYAVQVKSAIDGDVYAVVPETDDGTLAVSAEKIPGGGTAFFRVIVDFQTIDAVEPADAE